MQKPAAEGEEQIVGGCLGWMSSQVCCGRAARRRGGGDMLDFHGVESRARNAGIQLGYLRGIVCT